MQKIILNLTGSILKHWSMKFAFASYIQLYIGNTHKYSVQIEVPIYIPFDGTYFSVTRVDDDFVLCAYYFR